MRLTSHVRGFRGGEGSDSLVDRNKQAEYIRLMREVRAKSRCRLPPNFNMK